jgi:hypothetical protein
VNGASAPDTLKIPDWNIDSGARLNRIVETIEREKADLCLFQEVGQGDNALQGQAILSRYPLRASREIRFANQSDFWGSRPYLPNRAIMQRRLGWEDGAGLRVGFRRAHAGGLQHSLGKPR